MRIPGHGEIRCNLDLFMVLYMLMEERLSTVNIRICASSMEHPDRHLKMSAYFSHVFDTFTELCGDRKSVEDTAVICGLARLDGYKTVVVSFQGDLSVDPPKLPGPEGYRKCIRLAQLAEDFKKPVIFIFDLPVSSVSAEPEQEMLVKAVGEYLEAASSLRVPTIGIIICKNTTTSAIDICAADRIIILENGNNINSCPQIQNLLDLGIVNEIVKDTEGSFEETSKSLRAVVLKDLSILCQIQADTLVCQRRNKLQRQYLQLDVSRGVL